MALIKFLCKSMTRLLDSQRLAVTMWQKMNWDINFKQWWELTFWPIWTPSTQPCYKISNNGTRFNLVLKFKQIGLQTLNLKSALCKAISTKVLRKYTKNSWLKTSLNFKSKKKPDHKNSYTISFKSSLNPWMTSSFLSRELTTKLPMSSSSWFKQRSAISN